MRNSFYLTLILSFFLTSCTTEKKLFEKEIWWQGHWQILDDPSMFFSIGTKFGTTQFFISTKDSIYSNLLVRNLVDFNYKKKWKLMGTYDNQLIKIKYVGIEDYGLGIGEELELYGPAETEDELDEKIAIHLKPYNDILPLIPDSILFAR